MNVEWWRKQDGWDRLGYTLVLGLVVTAAAVLWAMVTATGGVSKCYISAIVQHNGQTRHQLVGVRPWRTDATLGYFPTFGEAVDAAGKMGCPLK